MTESCCASSEVVQIPFNSWRMVSIQFFPGLFGFVESISLQSYFRNLKQKFKQSVLPLILREQEF